MMLTNEKLKG